MPAYSLARKAESDLKSIGRFTLKTWGITQARRYVEDLQNCFQLLAQNPSLGCPCYEIIAGMRRFEHGRHVVFYFAQPNEILVVRILHQQMIPSKARFEP